MIEWKVGAVAGSRRPEAQRTLVMLTRLWNGRDAFRFDCRVDRRSQGCGQLMGGVPVIREQRGDARAVSARKLGVFAERARVRGVDVDPLTRQQLESVVDLEINLLKERIRAMKRLSAEYKTQALIADRRLLPLATAGIMDWRVAASILRKAKSKVTTVQAG